jgi:quercetin dioxygenase-like cupin family protein
MLGKSTQERYTEILPGIKIKTLVHGPKTMMTKFILAKGSVVPVHKHPYEQTGYLIKGRIRLTLGKTTFDVAENDSWCIDSDTEHAAEIIEDSVALEIFSPARPDYVPFHSNQDIAT